MNTEELLEQWSILKEQELTAQKKRREVEDEITAQLTLKEGVNKLQEGKYKCEITQRLVYDIDSDKLQELAHESGLTEHLSSLFRWKPDINLKAWKASAENITKPLLGAITTKLGRPTFAVKIEE